MTNRKYIFIILVYKNSKDLEECIESIKEKVNSFEIIVVNAFFDIITEQLVKEIAEKNNCVFINIENKGYSYGNNVGIKYAIDNYKFDYIVVSNPDILIEKFDDNLLKKGFRYGIVAPKITAANGNNQNPMAIFSNHLSDYLEYIGLKKNINFLFLLGICINKIMREFLIVFYKLLKKRQYKIYAAHGSFLLISQKAVHELFPVYDENVFLFAEEGILAYKAKVANIETCYLDDIHILHKEDGSMRLSNISISDELKKSNIYFYENYIKAKEAEL